VWSESAVKLKKNVRYISFRGFLLVVGLMAVLVWAPTAVRAQAHSSDKLDAPQFEFIFEELVKLGATEHPGKTPFGERNIVPITGGTVTGPKIKGTVMPGGWDWQLSVGGCNRLKADYMIRTDDGVIINVLNQATMCDHKDMANTVTMTSPVMEAPLGRYEWLNGGVYVGALRVTTFDGKPAVRIQFFRIH
jgi:hypothetical protein